MTSPSKSVKPQTSIKEIARLLATAKFYGVPVVDEQGHPVGMVTEVDLIDRVDADGTFKGLVSRSALLHAGFSDP